MPGRIGSSVRWASCWRRSLREFEAGLPELRVGILRAMGCSRRRILRIFLLQGGVVGLVGSLFGSGLGALLVTFFASTALNPDGTPIFPVVLETRMFLVASGIATITGILAAAAPAVRASKLDPVVAIRNV